MRLLLMMLTAGATMTAVTTAAGAQQRDTTVVVGQQYEAGGLHRFLFGSDYRDLWTMPITAQLLDLRTFGGGLTPTTAGGGMQTLSLRFRGQDGHEYGFRSINKDPDILLPELAGTVIDDIVQDQISSAHPAGPAVAAPLMEAADILHTNPRLVVLPDDPILGEHRDRFAGAIGFIEARAITGPGLVPFAGAAEIIDDDAIFVKLRESNRNRVHTRAYLRARLLDILIGDWDRHRGQWTWARFADEPVTLWEPIPEDRDQAFVRFDGFLLSVGRLTSPMLVNFGKKPPNTLGVNWNGRETDRHFLNDLERPVWDSIATALQTLWTDSVIDAAVLAMPAEYYAHGGPEMAEALKARRDWLASFAVEFYRMLAREVDIHASDEPESADIERRPDGSTGVTLTRGDGSVFYQRVFSPDETGEIRLYLYGGDDRVLVHGSGTAAVTVRIIAGDGRDAIENRSGTGGVHFYDSDDPSDIVGELVRVDRRPYTEPPRASGNAPPHRDWGALWRSIGWIALKPDVGLLLGAGGYRIGYGFRQFPYASRVKFRGGYAFEHRNVNAELQAVWYRANTDRRFELSAQLTGIEITRFHGLGNDVAAPDSSTFYLVNQIQVLIHPDLVIPLTEGVEVAAGAGLEYFNTRDVPGTFLTDSLSGIYGDNQFGQVGARLRITLDTRDVQAHPTRGIFVEVGASGYPGIWDVDSAAYGELHGAASTYLSALGAPLRPTLAVRAGAKKIFGIAPFHQAAFIGDERTVRLARDNRFGGDAAVWGNAELRIRFSRISLILPGDWGAFGLFDIGRVFLEGESSDTWHTAYGGGLWWAVLTHGNTLSLAWAQNEERGGLYLLAGFAF